MGKCYSYDLWVNFWNIRRRKNTFCGKMPFIWPVGKFFEIFEEEKTTFMICGEKLPLVFTAKNVCFLSVPVCSALAWMTCKQICFIFSPIFKRKTNVIWTRYSLKILRGKHLNEITGSVFKSFAWEIKEMWSYFPLKWELTFFKITFWQIWMCFR